MAPKFSRDHHVRDRTTIGEWHRNINEWLRQISLLDAEARRAFGRRFHSWTGQRRMHDQTTKRACILMQAETDDAMRQSTRFNPHVKNLNFLNFLRKSSFLFFFFEKKFEKHPVPQFFFAKEKVKLCTELLLWWFLPVLQNILLQLF